MRMRGALAGVMTGIILATFLLVGLTTAVQPTRGAALAAPTPAPVTRPDSPGYVVFTPFNSQAMTQTTTATCADVGRHSVVDVVYSIDQGTTNTVTLYSMWSINGTTLVTGTAIASAVAVDTLDMQQVQVFGRYLCVRAQTTNTNSVTVYVQGMAK